MARERKKYGRERRPDGEIDFLERARSQRRARFRKKSERGGCTAYGDGERERKNTTFYFGIYLEGLDFTGETKRRGV